MENNFIGSLLTDMDDVLLREIAEEYAAPFDKEVLFQRSYAKFQGATEIRNVSRSFFKRTAFRVMTAAACLLLTVGLSVGIWARQQKVETRPPQETQTATVTQTETRTETTAQATTELQTTRKRTETNLTTKRSTAAESVYDVAETSVSQTVASTAAPLTSSAQHPVTSSAIIAEATRTSTSLRLPLSPSYIPVRRDTQMPETRLPESTADPAQTTMLPVSDTTSVVVTFTETATGISVCDTGNTDIASVFPPESTSGTATETTVSTSEARPDLQQFSGFDVRWMYLSNDWREDSIQISRMQLVENSPYTGGIFKKYTVLSDYIHIVQEELADPMPSAHARGNALLSTYTAAVTESGQTFEVEQYMRSIRFRVQCDSSTRYTAGSLGSNPCVWLTKDEKCALYWDDGSYTFCVKGTISDQELLKEIAVCMRQKADEDSSEI